MTEEYKGPKTQYWHRSSGYRRIVQRNGGPFSLVNSLVGQISAIKASILSASPIARFAQLLLYAYVVAAVGAFVGLAYFLKSVQRVDSTFLILLALGVAYLVLAWCYNSLTSKYSNLQAIVLSKHRSRFQSEESALRNAELACEHAEQNILAEWDAYCVNFDKYPPDWDERKALVQKSDNFKCAICDWPKGQQVLRRNLHVHHKLPLSKGGDNSLGNLTTLCHMCHRKQEGSGHKRIKYRKRNSH